MANTKSILTKKLDALWRKRAVEVWGSKCTTCSNQGDHVHHYIPRSKSLNLRFNIKNAVLLCHKCHYKIHFSNDPHVSACICNAIIHKRGDEWLEYIETNRKISAKNTVWWLKEQEEKLLCL